MATSRDVQHIDFQNLLQDLLFPHKMLLIIVGSVPKLETIFELRNDCHREYMFKTCTSLLSSETIKDMKLERTTKGIRYFGN